MVHRNGAGQRGLPEKSCARIGTGAPTKTCQLSSPENQSYWAVTYTVYTDTGQVKQVRDPDGNWAFTYYDELDRPIVTVDPEGRKTRTVYDDAGRTLRIVKGWAGANDNSATVPSCDDLRAATVADPVNNLQQCYQEYTYTDNGQIETVEDANGNRTTYEYDAFDRLEYTRFPTKDTIHVSASRDDNDPNNDYEKYTYDNNGNMVAKRTRKGQNITFIYDDLNRLTRRNVPDGRHYAFTYDLAGRQLRATNGDLHQDHKYDNAGRLEYRKHSHNATAPDKEGYIRYEYDPAGNVTRLTHTDQYYVSYTYDDLNRVKRACEEISSTACASASTPLAAVDYDLLSRRKSLTLGNGSSSRYDYTTRGDLTCLDWNFTGAASACGGGAPDIAYGFTYNGVGQLTQKTVSDGLLYWAPSGNNADDYAVNGLNQYTSVVTNGVANTITHDKNGNVITDHRGQTYSYDAENRLKSIKDASNNNLFGSTIWADGTYAWVNTPGWNIYHMYDGDQEIFETTGYINFADNEPFRRYIRLPGSVDEPLLMINYNFNNGEEQSRQWAHANRIGSVVATTDENGGDVERYKYSPYGVSGDEGDTGFPFRFTGQKIYADSGLYHYKARWYDPEVGRFLQTDPIGYEDQQNMYAYVRNDPIKYIDPNGQETRVRIRAYRLTQFPGNLLNQGHAFVQYEDTVTGMDRITRAGPGVVPIDPSGTKLLIPEDRLTVLSTDFQVAVFKAAIGGNLEIQDLVDVTIPDDFSDVQGRVDDFNNAIEDSPTHYDALNNNSNTYAGDAFEAITGQNAPNNNTSLGLAGYANDLQHADSTRVHAIDIKRPEATRLNR